jgi:hypothetical protein
VTVREPSATPDPDGFIARWAPSGGQESANYQLFLTELCDLLDLPHPDPAIEETRENAYVFERRVEEQPAADRRAGTGRPAAGARRALRPQHQGATAPRRSCR